MINLGETTLITLHSYDDDNVYRGSFEYHWATGTGFAANATDVKLPEYIAGFVPVFNGLEWDLLEDNRGKTVYSIETKMESIIDYLGPIRAGFTFLAPTSIFETWTGSAWIDPRTPEEIETHRLAQFPALKRRQFMRVLVLNGFDLDQIESEINKIPDTQTRQLALIDWKDATEFWRTDETLLMVADLLGLNTARIDAMWEQAQHL